MEMGAFRVAGGEFAPPQEDAAIRIPLGPFRMKGQFTLLRDGLPAESFPGIQVIAEGILGESLPLLRERRSSEQGPCAVGHPFRLDFAVSREVIHPCRLEENSGRLHLGISPQRNPLLPNGKHDAVQRLIGNGVRCRGQQGIHRRFPGRLIQSRCWSLPRSRRSCRIRPPAERESGQGSRILSTGNGVFGKAGQVGKIPGRSRQQGDGGQAGGIQPHADFGTGCPIGLGQGCREAVPCRAFDRNAVRVREVERASIATDHHLMEGAIHEKAVEVPPCNLMVEALLGRTRHEGIAPHFKPVCLTLVQVKADGISCQLVLAAPQDRLSVEVHPVIRLGPGQTVGRTGEFIAVQRGPFCRNKRSAVEGIRGNVELWTLDEQGCVPLIQPGRSHAMQGHPSRTTAGSPPEGHRIPLQAIGGCRIRKDHGTRGDAQRV